MTKQKQENESKQVGDIEWESGFFRDTWTVTDEVRKNYSSATMFHNFERAKIFSELVKLKNLIKREGDKC